WARFACQASTPPDQGPSHNSLPASYVTGSNSVHKEQGRHQADPSGTITGPDRPDRPVRSSYQPGPTGTGRDRTPDLAGPSQEPVMIPLRFCLPRPSLGGDEVHPRRHVVGVEPVLRERRLRLLAEDAGD